MVPQNDVTMIPLEKRMVVKVIAADEVVVMMTLKTMRENHESAANLLEPLPVMMLLMLEDGYVTLVVMTSPVAGTSGTIPWTCGRTTRMMRATERIADASVAVAKIVFLLNEEDVMTTMMRMKKIGNMTSPDGIVVIVVIRRLKSRRKIQNAAKEDVKLTMMMRRRM